MKVGDRQAFVANLVDVARTRAVSTVWSSDNEGVATVDQVGMVVARASGKATIVATAEGQKASAQLRVFVNVDGTWLGTGVVETCVFESGTPPDPCRFGGVGVSLPLQLQLQQAGGQLTGTLTTLNLEPLKGPVRGTLLEDYAGMFQLSGELASAAGETATFISWFTSYDMSTGKITGHVPLHLRFTNVFGLQGVEWLLALTLSR